MNKKIKVNTPTAEPKKHVSLKKKSITKKTKPVSTAAIDDFAAPTAKQHSTEIVPTLEQAPMTKTTTPIVEKSTSAATATLETPEEQTETNKETTEKIHEAAALKEKLIDRQLEMLWANGRKQLINQPPQQVKMPSYPENSPLTEAPHKPIKQ